MTVIISKANSLFEIFSDYTGMGETGELYLIDKDGYMITPPRFEGPTGFKHKVDTQEANLCLREHTQEGLPKEMEEIPIIYVDYRGVNVLGTHAYIPEMEWCMLTEIGEAEAFLPYLNLQRNLNLNML